MGKLNFMLYGFNCVQGSSMRLHFSTMKVEMNISYCLSLTILVAVWVSFVWCDVYLCFVLTEISYFPCEDSLSKLQDLSYFSSKLVWLVFHKTTLAFFIRNGDQKETEYGIIDVNILPKLTTLVQLIPFLQPIGKPIGSSRNSLLWMAWFFTEDASVQC